MKRGRKPKPSALKRLEGNPGKRPISDREPKAWGVPRCPQWLSPRARKVWRQTMPDLIRMRIAARLDTLAHARYCQEIVLWHEARELVERLGVVITTTNGNLVQNPALGIMHTADRNCRSHEAAFGMNPSARSTIQVPVEPAAGDPIAQLKLVC